MNNKINIVIIFLLLIIILLIKYRNISQFNVNKYNKAKEVVYVF